MIKNLEIKNFKSIKHLKLDCKRINIFIGEPNTGKSNILESLGLLSHGFYGNIKNFVRFESMTNLFYDENLEDDIEIKFDEKVLEIYFKEEEFHGKFYSIPLQDKGKKYVFCYDYTSSSSVKISPEEFSPFKFYRFITKENFSERKSDFLLPPSGDNLLAILMTHKELKSIAKRIFDPFGFMLVFKPQERKIEVLKQYEDVFISFPYSLASETLQRILFYLIAIGSNKNSILVFEEPEAHAFPYYTKYLAERIALDENKNQYFISTHNPYILLSILEKARKDEVAIFITYFEDYQTKVKPLSQEELEEILEMGIDVFFNFERFLEDKK